MPEDLQDEIIQKIEQFQDINNHSILKVHKLSGRLKGRYSFYINYKIRIVFVDTTKKPKCAILLAVGDHDVYKK